MLDRFYHRVSSIEQKGKFEMAFGKVEQQGLAPQPWLQTHIHTHALSFIWERSNSGLISYLHCTRNREFLSYVVQSLIENTCPTARLSACRINKTTPAQCPSTCTSIPSPPCTSIPSPLRFGSHSTTKCTWRAIGTRKELSIQVRLHYRAREPEFRCLPESSIYNLEP